MTPYNKQGRAAFWRAAISGKDPTEIGPLWTPKFSIGKTDRIATAGSCFAQHIGSALRANDFAWLDCEPPPPGMSAEDAKALGYCVFSFRSGNIYSGAQFRQWVGWSAGETAPDEVWEDKGRFYDPFRPSIEPGGFGSAAEVAACRQGTIAAARRTIEQCDVFVFTLGLTEGWMNKATGLHYPMCPGTVAGTFDPSVHRFSNHRYPRLRRDLEQSFAIMRDLNPRLKIILTVSPIPLAATATAHHVLVASSYSKAVLRAAAGDLSATHPFVDYFPAYEIVTGAPYRGMFLRPDGRNVTAEGVAFVMRHFFRGLGDAAERTDAGPAIRMDGPRQDSDDDAACEEELLNAFWSKS